MRTIGIDLALTSAHRAVVMDEQGHCLTPVLKVTTRAAALDALLRQARAGAPEAPVRVVLEPTGMAWFPVAVYLLHQGVTVYLVKSQQVAALRRYYRRHAKSDRIDARVLAKLPLHSPETLQALRLVGATALACQRGCLQAERWGQQIAASKNRLKALLRFAWPGFETVFPDLDTVPARWFSQHWLNPYAVRQAGLPGLQQAWQESGLKPVDSSTWGPALVALAQEVIALYGPTSRDLDFEQLQAEVTRELEVLAFLETQRDTLRRQTIRPLYQQLQPEPYLETLKGVGPEGAAVYASFIGEPLRFASLRQFRGWSGMTPESKESAQVETKGLPLNHAGPRLIKKYAFIDADTARQWDPQFAALYYDQMVHKGKHHAQAVCACATHLLDRVLVILREHRPYVLRTVEGTPVTAQEARRIIAEKYTVPAEVRRRTTKRYRQARRDQRAELEQKREIGRTQVRSKP